MLLSELRASTLSSATRIMLSWGLTLDRITRRQLPAGPRALTEERSARRRQFLGLRFGSFQKISSLDLLRCTTPHPQPAPCRPCRSTSLFPSCPRAGPPTRISRLLVAFPLRPSAASSPSVLTSSPTPAESATSALSLRTTASRPRRLPRRSRTRTMARSLSPRTH